MMQRAKILSSFLLFVVLQACTGGSACSGCGVEPIPGGFPLDHRVTRALQARLTPNAFTFLEENAATLVSTLVTGGLSFAIPETTTNVAVVGDVTICPGGGCTATATVTALDLQSTPPSSIVAVARLEVVTTNIRINMASNWMCLFLEAPQCDVDLDTRRTDPTYNTIRATLTITIDTRTGYADLDVTDAGLADDIQDGDLRIRGANTCGGIWCSVANIGFIKGYILDTLQSQLTTTLTDQISSFTCMACPEAPATCPTGTSCNADSAFCEYSDGTCVPILLGLEGQIDLGAMLASVSPGISAPVMFVDAAGDYAVADGSGYNIGVYGGLEPVTRSACIPSSYAPDPALYTPVPLATEFSTGSDFTGCRRCPTGSECSSGYTCSASGRCDDAAGACEQVTQPVMIKLGVAERYLDRVGAGLFEAGALCLSVGTSTVAQLNSTMLALLMPTSSMSTSGGKD